MTANKFPASEEFLTRRATARNLAKEYIHDEKRRWPVVHQCLKDGVLAALVHQAVMDQSHLAMMQRRFVEDMIKDE